MQATTNISHIRALSTETRTRLRSTQILTSLNQIVSELVQNSLDAGATHVDVGVDCAEWSCWVRDDGCGIYARDLELFGEAADSNRYRSSKVYAPHSPDSVATFGFRGEALASAGNLACIEISSRTTSQNESWSVITKAGKRLYFGPALRWRRERPGTTVCIREAFYNVPVRRRAHPNASRTLDLITRELQSFALVFPLVAFSLENCVKTRDGEMQKQRFFSVPKTGSSLLAFRSIFGRALAEHVDEIDTSFGELRLTGFISREGAPSKAHQFLYINRHPLAPCELHRVIDIKFSSSSFGKNAYDELGESSRERFVNRRSPRKHERRPVYVLNLDVPPSTLDVCLVPSKDAVQFQDVNAVSSFLISTIQSFLIKHGFATASSKIAAHVANQSGNSPSPPPTKRRKFNSSVDVRLAASLRSTFITPATVSAHFKPEERDEIYVHHGDGFLSETEPETVQWVDPGTREVFFVDKRTGNSYKRDTTTATGEEEPHLSIAGSGSYVDRSRLKKSHQKSGHQCNTSEHEKPQWINDMLEGWDNPAFLEAEANIPMVTIPTSNPVDEGLSFPKSTKRTNPTSRFFDTNTLSAEAKAVTRKFTRDDLTRAEVINQVDAKFILCVLSPSPDISQTSKGSKSSSAAVVLVDQHAADERIRVERFLEEICSGFLTGGVERKDLSEHPARILLTLAEAQALAVSEDIRLSFDRWGIQIPKNSAEEPAELAQSGEGDTGYVQIEVHSIPAIVADKLLMDHELRDLVKGFLAKLSLEDFTRLPPLASPSDIGGELHAWTKALRWCPKELIDLINSKACRGAIMFNDPLHIDQCKRLISQLAGTVFPFQCAHGRPSLVPMTSISNKRWRSTEKKSVNWRAFLFG